MCYRTTYHRSLAPEWAAHGHAGLTLCLICLVAWSVESNVFAQTQLFFRATETSTTSPPSIFTTSSSTIQRRIPYVSSKYLSALRCAPLSRTLPNTSVGITCVLGNPMNLLVSARFNQRLSGKLTMYFANSF